MPLVQGQILNNRYRVVKLLAQGGFGTVYRVWEINLERPLALKENLDPGPESQRQFKREAQMLFDLTHPNLPKVIDYFDQPGMGQYLVMEFVEGEDLEQMWKRRGGPLPEAQVLEWIEPVCDALQYLHCQNPPVIHRDIKPANIKITPRSKAMLVDFGIAKFYDPVRSTTSGARAVTPGYSPHEQYGQGRTDARSDIYALGATLYHLFSGALPTESIQRMIDDPLPPLETLNPSVSPVTCQAICKALAMDPRQRYQSMAEFKAALYPATYPQPLPIGRGAAQPVSRTAPSPQASAVGTAAMPPPVAGPPPANASLPAPVPLAPAAIVPTARSDTRRLALLAVFVLLVGLSYFATQSRMLGNIDAFGGPALPLWIVPLGMVLAAPIWGYLSDRRGRRLVLLVSMLGLMITSAIPMLVPNPNRLYLGLLLVSIFYSGLLPVSLAYASDLSDEKKRAGAVGLLAAAFTLASLGPQLLGYNAPPIFAVSSAVLALGLAFVFLKEPSGSRPTVASSFLDGTRRSISALWGVFLVALLGIAWLQSPPLTEIGAHFGLSYFGYPSIIVVFIAIFLQAVLLRPLIGRWGEKSLIRVSLLVGVLAIILNISMSFYINPYTTVISLGFLVLAGKVAEPTVFTLISKRSQQGTGLALGLGSGFLILGGWINQLLQDQIQQSFGINATAMLVIFMLLLAFGVSFWALKRV